MKRIFQLFILLIASTNLWLTAGAQSSHHSSPKNQPSSVQNKSEILTNDSIISLAQAKFKEKTILSLIRTSPVAFDISAPKLIQLKKNGVSENVIQGMIERQSAINGFSRLRDEEFFSADDEAFFKSPPRLSLPDTSRDEARGTLDQSKDSEIFGSRSGGKSRSQTRGGRGGEASGSSESTGSATVRIIKPPTEGGAEPRLERAPRLTNQAVLEMVQAGFSEGTILRKIEITQVDFDISTAALDNLRKNRVSDKILKAMRIAMDEK